MKKVLAFLAAVMLAGAAHAQPVVIENNASAYPLSSNILFPERAGGRLALRCYNPTTNAAATIAYGSFSFVLQPGGSLWDVSQGVQSGRATNMYHGAITSTGTSTQTLQCSDMYRAQ